MNRFRSGTASVAFVLCLGFSIRALADPSVFEAAKSGNLADVQQALAQGSDLNQFGGAVEGTALFYAVLGDNTDVVRWLLAQGADPNLGLKKNFPPLMPAAHGGNLDVIRVLLDAGAEVNQGDYSGYTPLMIAAQENRAAAAQVLVDHGANVNTRDDSGATALSIAAGKRGSVALVRYLIEQGADFQQADNHGFTPLYRAEQAEDDDIQALLQERIAQATAGDKPVESKREVLAYDCDVMMASVELVIGTLEMAGTGSAVSCALLESTGQSLRRTRLYMADAASNGRCDVTQEDADGYASSVFDTALETGLANCTR
jgi:hypothetical protein